MQQPSVKEGGNVLEHSLMSKFEGNEKNPDDRDM